MFRALLSKNVQNTTAYHHIHVLFVRLTERGVAALPGDRDWTGGRRMLSTGPIEIFAVRPSRQKVVYHSRPI